MIGIVLNSFWFLLVVVGNEVFFIFLVKLNIWVYILVLVLIVIFVEDIFFIGIGLVGIFFLSVFVS